MIRKRIEIKILKNILENECDENYVEKINCFLEMVNSNELFGLFEVIKINS